MSNVVLNPERLRILRAAADKRLKINELGRYVILDENRPNRPDREWLLRNGCIAWSWDTYFVRLTEKGRAVLEQQADVRK